MSLDETRVVICPISTRISVCYISGKFWHQLLPICLWHADNFQRIQWDFDWHEMGMQGFGWFEIYFHSKKLGLCVSRQLQLRKTTVCWHMFLSGCQRDESSLELRSTSDRLFLFYFKTFDFKTFIMLRLLQICFKGVQTFVYSWETFESYLVQLSWTIFWVLT